MIGVGSVRFAIEFNRLMPHVFEQRRREHTRHTVARIDHDFQRTGCVGEASGDVRHIA